MRIGIGILTVVVATLVSLADSQTQSVQLCPLYLVLQNRCPTTSTTSTLRTTTVSNSNETDSSSESDVVDDCSLPLITFCPTMQIFLSGDRNCTNAPTIQIKLTTLARLVIRPSSDKAAEMVGSNNVDDLGDALASVSKTIQATPTQATGTIGVTFIPVGQIIG